MEASAFQNNKSFWHVLHAAASKLSVSFSCQYQKNPPKLFAPADQSKCITVLSKALIFPLNGYTSFEMPVPDRGTERKEWVIWFLSPIAPFGGKISAGLKIVCNTKGEKNLCKQISFCQWRHRVEVSRHDSCWNTFFVIFKKIVPVLITELNSGFNSLTTPQKQGVGTYTAEWIKNQYFWLNKEETALIYFVH